ncbi:MAG: hypothetical protein MJA83_01375 [Gammaproteobacteria bacterium]|nr:hypothetical protein [Gammaproteobacteria bacterium]
MVLWLHKIDRNILLFSALLIVCNALSAQEYDPHTRDEDISLARIDSSFQVDEQGHYEYNYTIDYPIGGLGEIGFLMLNLSCPGSFDYPDFDPEQYESPGTKNYSLNGMHVPAAIINKARPGKTSNITSSNKALWSLKVKPGDTHSSMKIVSTQPPGYRVYKLIPWLSTAPPWDYSDIDDSDDVPWIEDFAITGLTYGPACPGEELDNTKPPFFPGSFLWGETREQNQLLGYEVLNRDRIHLPAAMPALSVRVAVVYGETIDPESFEVITDNPAIPPLFNPQPGTRQFVTIPLTDKYTKIELRVKGDIVDPANGEIIIVEDIDYFEIRRDQSKF